MMILRVSSAAHLRNQVDPIAYLRGLSSSTDKPSITS